MLSVLLLVSLLVSNSYSELSFSNRIIGGEPIDISTVPFQVAIDYNNIFTCGGVLITFTHVLTAAHCVCDRYEVLPAGRFIVYAGSNFQTSTVSSKVNLIIKHYGYNYRLLLHNIAVMKLSTSLQGNTNVNVVRLPAQSYIVPEGSKVVASGWGRTDVSSAAISDVLLAAELQVINYYYCVRAYSHINTVYYAYMVCAGVPDASKDVCNGDFGGPLMFGNVLVGITSFNNGCAKTGYPTVFTQISYYLGFIRRSTAV